jgi:hypothetical protein
MVPAPEKRGVIQYRIPVAPCFSSPVVVVNKTKDILRESGLFTCGAGISQQPGQGNSTTVLQGKFRDFYVFCSVRGR